MHAPGPLLRVTAGGEESDTAEVCLRLEHWITTSAARCGLGTSVLGLVSMFMCSCAQLGTRICYERVLDVNILPGFYHNPTVLHSDPSAPCFN